MTSGFKFLISNSQNDLIFRFPVPVPSQFSPVLRMKTYVIVVRFLKLDNIYTRTLEILEATIF